MCSSTEKITNVDTVDISLLHPIVNEYKDIKGSTITVLQKTQEIYGYLPLDAINYISSELNIKPAKLYGIATFYTQFSLNPAGKNMIMLCQGTACHVNGSKAIETILCETLGVEPGQTTPDGLFTFHSVACLGCCSLSPVMMINNEAYGSLTPEEAKKIILNYK